MTWLFAPALALSPAEIAGCILLGWLLRRAWERWKEGGAARA